MTKRCGDEANCINGTPKRYCCRQDEEEGRMDATSRWLPQWRRKLRLLGVGYEELLLGWFPFEEDDFSFSFSSVDKDLGFDDIWQIKHINQIPSQSQSADHGGGP